MQQRFGFAKSSVRAVLLAMINAFMFFGSFDGDSVNDNMVYRE